MRHTSLWCIINCTEESEDPRQCQNLSQISLVFKFIYRLKSCASQRQDETILGCLQFSSTPVASFVLVVEKMPWGAHFHLFRSSSQKSITKAHNTILLMENTSFHIIFSPPEIERDFCVAEAIYFARNTGQKKLYCIKISEVPGFGENIFQ